MPLLNEYYSGAKVISELTSFYKLEPLSKDKDLILILIIVLSVILVIVAIVIAFICIKRKKDSRLKNGLLINEEKDTTV